MQICNYAQKQCICRENCKYAFDENFHGHFCPRRKAAKFCHPGADPRKVIEHAVGHSLLLGLYHINAIDHYQIGKVILYAPVKMLPLASNTADENDWEKKADKDSPVSEKRETDRHRQDLESGVGEEEREKEGSFFQLFFGGESSASKMINDCSQTIT